MKMWLDTEFDGFGGQLISIALIAEDGRVFSEVLKNTATDPWVLANVIPHITQSPRPRESVQAGLEYFLCYGNEEIEIIADWPDDIRYLCELFITGPGTRISLPMLTMRIDLRLNSEESVVPHNAMHDAIALKEMYERLTAPRTKV